MTKLCKKCETVQPLEAFASHKQTRDKKYPICRGCQRIKSQEWARANRARHAANSRAWDKANPEKRKAMNSRWRQENPDRMQQARASWKKANPGPNSSPEYMAAWRAANKARVQVYDRLRRAALKAAFPVWADVDAINAVYGEAVQRTIETGQAHEVDHIVPLRSRLVCGLHVAANLQVMDSISNRRKGNRHWPEMP